MSGNNLSGLFGEIKNALEPLGYILEKPLSENRSNGSSNAQVWLSTFNDASGVSEKRALKFSSTLFMGSGAMNTSTKLESLAEREFEILQLIDNPNIPEFKGVEKITIRDFLNFDVLATEYIDMPNMLDDVVSGKKINEDQAKTVLHDVLFALDHCHTGLSAPVLHRDIKPSNILYNGGEKAYLFDFNFSKIGQPTSAVTVVDNYGYYPMDTYSGLPTASQDLVALGNVVIAALSGKDIAAVRTMQGKGGFDQVDVKPLNISTKMKIFIRKLTTENPAMRYQTAKQALSDLDNLDNLSEKELEEKEGKITRSNGLVKLLGSLKEQDKTFEYNVPPAILQNYDDDSLLDHLEKTYLQEAFVISDPIQIKKYLSQGDKVEKKGSFKEVLATLKNGSNGIITDVSSQKKGYVTVKFDKTLWNIKLEDLIVKGRKRFFKVDDKLTPVNAANTLGPLEKKYLVEYFGADRFNYGSYIPDGSKGIVVDPQIAYGKKPLFVVWEESSDLTQNILTSYSTNQGTKTGIWGSKPNFYLDYSDVRLHKRNPVDFKKLYELSFKEE